MAIRKDKSSPLVKAGVIFIVFVFVVALIPWGNFSAGQSTTTNTATGGDAIATKHRPIVEAQLAAVRANAKDYNAHVNLGNAYYDWALEVQQKNTGGDQPIWVASAGAYAKALDLQAGNAAVTTDYSIALFYSGDTSAAIAAIEPIVKKDKSFTNAFKNAAIYYSAAGQNAKAVEVLQTFLKNNPNSPDAATIQADLQKYQSQAGTSGTSGGGTSTTTTP